MTVLGIPHLTVWRRIRRYAVPAAMVEACAAAREAGDWRAACAAGRIDVAFDLADVRREHGDRQADLIEADLAVFAPDLLRWHLPRVLGGRTSIATHETYLLSARDGRVGADDVGLVLTTPKTVDGSQRLRLTVGKTRIGGDQGLIDLSPVFWSAAHVGGLAAAYGGSPDRLPGFEPDGTIRPFEAYATEVVPGDPASRWEVYDRRLVDGDVVGAWAVGGADLDPTEPDHRSVRLSSMGNSIVALGVAAEMARLHARHGVDEAKISGHWGPIAVVSRDAHGRPGVRMIGYDPKTWRLPQLAPLVHTRPADLELVRAGWIGRADLHPLVRQALFPGSPAPDAPSAGTDLRVSVPVRCRGAWHTVVHADGRLTPVSHPPEEVSRERMLRTLGGQVSGCFAAVEAWHGSADRLPRPLRELRRHVLQRVQHGGSAALAEMLDAGLDPRMVDGRGGTLLHHTRAMDDPALVRRLIDVGVPVDAADRRGRTALHVTVSDGGTVEQVRALLEAGADPHLGGGDTTAAEIAEYKSELHVDDDEPHPMTAIRKLIDEWETR
ncbi:ankyrin repeat domain-containing protein [Polymorphospora sp. NPDC051019]|uniref:ankyrin repeat domain-containing protein n=1 Tax=Polymorphospora sp. NPDC051019 TaxID=3155725 RepID=UPI003423EF7C